LRQSIAQSWRGRTPGRRRELTRPTVAQRRALLEQTPIHHREDSRLHRARRRLLIDDVDPLVGPHHLRQLIEGGDRRLTENRLGERVHRDDAVAETLQRLRHAVTRPRPVRRQTDDGDGAGGAQEPRDILRLRVQEHPGSVALTRHCV